MYESDPLTRWTPAIGDFLGMKPEDLFRLTPTQLEAAEEWVEQRLKHPLI